MSGDNICTWNLRYLTSQTMLCITILSIYILKIKLYLTVLYQLCINHVFTFKTKPCYCFLVLRKRKFKQWWWPIPLISIKRTLTSQLNSLNTKRLQHMKLEIQVLAWNRHKYDNVRLLIGSATTIHIKQMIKNLCSFTSTQKDHLLHKTAT